MRTEVLAEPDAELSTSFSWTAATLFAISNLTFAVVSGGVACLGVVAAVAAKMPELRRYTVEPRASDEAEPMAIATGLEEHPTSASSPPAAGG